MHQLYLFTPLSLRSLSASLRPGFITLSILTELWKRKVVLILVYAVKLECQTESWQRYRSLAQTKNLKIVIEIVMVTIVTANNLAKILCSADPCVSLVITLTLYH